MASPSVSQITHLSSCERFVHISDTTLHQRRVDLVHRLRESPRVRRRHTKSRTGCVTCKRRRIKCDEAIPTCGNCGKRGESCVRPRAKSSRVSSPSPSSPRVPQRKAPRQRERSLQMAPSMESLCLVEDHGIQMELMHHFVTHTATTLVFNPDLWRGPLLRLSLRVDYLRNAVLLIAATHRSILAASPDPEQDRYHHAARIYLTKTLCGYQHALSYPLSSTTPDALIAVSVLLYHYAWSSVDNAVAPFALSQSSIVSREPTSGLDLAGDPLLNLSVGLRYLFWKMGVLAAGSESVFHPYALEKPRIRIVQAVQRQWQHDTLGEMELYLLRGFRSPSLSVEKLEKPSLQWSPHGMAGDPMTLAAYSESAGRLAPILGVLSSSIDVRDGPTTSDDLHRSQDSPAVRQSDIIRYLFSYPIHFCDTFRSLAAAHDRRALFLLYHFFHAVRRLLPPDRCWWSHRRATLLEHQLKCILEVQPAIPEQCTGSITDTATEWSSDQMRNWLDGECIHGDF